MLALSDEAAVHTANTVMLRSHCITAHVNEEPKKPETKQQVARQKKKKKMDSLQLLRFPATKHGSVRDAVLRVNFPQTNSKTQYRNVRTASNGFRDLKEVKLKSGM